MAGRPPNPPHYLLVCNARPGSAHYPQAIIDAKDGGVLYPNSVNLAEEGLIPVALLGSEDFDIAQVDATTLAFGPGGAALGHSHGPHVEDMNADGMLDLVAHFFAQETGIEFGDQVACLSGETLEGRRFEGCDDVRTVPDMDGDALLDVDETTIGTDALNPDTDGDGFSGGVEVLELGTDPLDPLDPESDRLPEPTRWLMLVARTAFLGALHRRHVH